MFLAVLIQVSHAEASELLSAAGNMLDAMKSALEDYTPIVDNTNPGEIEDAAEPLKDRWVWYSLLKFKFQYCNNAPPSLPNLLCLLIS